MNYLYTTIYHFFILKLDFAKPLQVDFQDPATPVMEAIVNFHHDLMFYLLLIVIFTFWMCIRSIFFFEEKGLKPVSPVVHATFIEIVWTICYSAPLLIWISVSLWNWVKIFL